MSIRAFAREKRKTGLSLPLSNTFMSFSIIVIPLQW
ncbi:hypothetical protein AGR8A_Lc10166 [Agrobacterium fabrum str. J-07]|nr:hypothetical protein AGR8A_Lc10166 [Agrobacterium fabrum str. J-07]